jgi:hypothetical protein
VACVSRIALGSRSAHHSIARSVHAHHPGGFGSSHMHIARCWRFIERNHGTSHSLHYAVLFYEAPLGLGWVVEVNIDRGLLFESEEWGLVFVFRLEERRLRTQK